MNKAKIIFCMCSLLALPTFARQIPFGDVDIHIGADAQQRSMPLQNDFGGNVTKKNYLQGSVYGGFRLDDLFGLELGYQKTASASRGRQIDQDYLLFGDLQFIAPGTLDIVNTKSSLKGPYASLVGLLPISESYRLKLITSFGIARLKLHVESHISSVPVAPTTLAGFFKTAWVPKLGIGFQHMMNDHLGARAMFAWEKTSRFNRIVGTDLRDGTKFSSFFASLKNSTTVGAGVFYSF